MATLDSAVVLHNNKGETKKHYLDKWVLYLSIPQVLFGVACVISQSLHVYKKTEFHFLIQGFWAGFLFIVAGILGIVSSQRKTTGTIIAFLVLSVFAAGGSVGLLVLSAIEWDYYRTFDSNRRRRIDDNAGKIAIPLNAILVFIAVIQGILAILCFAFACHGLCCGEKKQKPHQAMIGQIQYLTAANGQPQMVVIPMGQQDAALQPTGESTMPTAGFNAQPTQPTLYKSATITPTEKNMQETLGSTHMQ